MHTIKLVCVIDDDPLYNFGMKKILEHTSLAEESVFFKNGEEALNGLKEIIDSGKHFPDLILLDINMPILNGWGFLENYAEMGLNRDTKIFMVSSSINQEEVDKAKSTTLVSGYIFKPLTIEKVNKLKENLKET
jgi:CheY-like chemotaxis protein